jgi:hypothetical protein
VTQHSGSLIFTVMLTFTVFANMEVTTVRDAPKPTYIDIMAECEVLASCILAAVSVPYTNI